MDPPKSKIKRFKFSFRKSQNESNMPEIDQILDYNRQHPIPGEISPTDSVSTLNSDPYVPDSDTLQKKQRMRHLQRPVSMDASCLSTDSQRQKVSSVKIRNSRSAVVSSSQIATHTSESKKTIVSGQISTVASETKTITTSGRQTPKTEPQHNSDPNTKTSTTSKSQSVSFFLSEEKEEAKSSAASKKDLNLPSGSSLSHSSLAKDAKPKNVVLRSLSSPPPKTVAASTGPKTVAASTAPKTVATSTAPKTAAASTAPTKETPLPPETKPLVADKTEKTTMVVQPCPRYSLGFLNHVQNRHTFSKAVSKQNEVATTAIQSLDCLNDQIVQYIVSAQCQGAKDGRASDESVQSSMVLIRRLLLDAQVRFRKMVEDNRQLANHIDTSIQAANQEVTLLKAELASTNKKLSQFGVKDDMGKVDKGIQVDRNFVEELSKGDKSDSDKEDMEVTVQSLTRENEQLLEDYKHLIEEHDALKCTQDDIKRENENLKAENARLETQLKSLKKDFDEVRMVKLEAVHSDSKPSYGEIKLELIQAKQELNRAKEVLQGMKSDRKRLKGEKLDLLSQMKQLYTTLEEKETELRDFIHNYEQRVKESDDIIKQLAKEKENVENEKWEIITKAKDAAERSMILKTQLDAKEQALKEAEAQLKELRDQLASQDNNVTSTTGHTSQGETIITDIDDDSIVAAEDNGFSTMEESSVLNCTFNTDLDNGAQVISTSPISITDSNDNSSLVFRWFTQSSDFELPLESKPSKKKKKNFGGSLSRVFSKGRMRRSIAVPHAESIITEDTCPKLCVLSQDNYQEKLNTIEKMVGVHMKEWRAHQVLAWLEITLAMPMYAQNCLLNVKSGLILLGLSDSELSAALGVTNPMHRRKLRIAIEQHRNPNEIKYIKGSEMDPTWIAHRFLPDLGLPQYTDVFEEQLCDGHVLNTLTRRDLEKYFSVHRKFHQSSILHAIELLRRIDFNKEKLYHRRNLCEDKDFDLIVWTNERLMKWTRKIDLGEYSEALIESGVHGAMMVLEPSFNSDTLASILGIPPSKSYIRRHLATELEIILKPARAALDNVEAKSIDNSKNNSNRSRKSLQEKNLQVAADKGRRKSAEEGRSRLSFRGSLGRAFGKKVRDDLKMNLDTSKISAPIPIQHSSLSSLDNNSELLRKGFCVKDPQKDVYNSKPLKNPQINGLVTQDMRRLCLTKSDQTLHKSTDYNGSDAKNPKTNLDKSCQDILLEGVKILQDGVDSNEMSSIGSSQETLTDQPSKLERNNNLQKNMAGVQTQLPYQSLPEIPQKSQSSPIISPHVASLLLSTIPNKSTTSPASNTKSTSTKLFSRHSSWLEEDNCPQKKKSLLKLSSDKSQRHSSSSLVESLLRLDHRSEVKKSTTPETKDRLNSVGLKQNILPQTTSV
ncbi:kazrin isoform X2 [Biomphalaria glabrata]|nr:kazrin isoform X2 [Biomphalaria glabrata]